ncbi:MAG: BrnT family toxin [Sphingomonadaceae bacterium]
MGFEYDPVKNAGNIEKHGLPLDVAPLLFLGPFIEEEVIRPGLTEARFQAIGPIDRFGDRLFVVVYTWRDGRRRIISFRKANEREARRYRRDHR